MPRPKPRPSVRPSQRPLAGGKLQDTERQYFVICKFFKSQKNIRFKFNKVLTNPIPVLTGGENVDCANFSSLILVGGSNVKTLKRVKSSKN